MKPKFIYALALSVLAALPGCSDENDKGVEMFSGNDITGKARIDSDKTSKAVTLTTAIGGGWQLYSGASVETIDYGSPILTGVSGGVYTMDLNTSYRSYFQLVTQEGTAVLAERCLPVRGCYHFRDMGGYKTTDGRYTRWGQLFRTDEFTAISDADNAYLNSLPLRTTADFRSVEEATGKPNILPESVQAAYDLNISIGNFLTVITDMAADGSLFTATEADMEALMCDTYRQFVTEEACIEQFAKLFELLQDKNNLPLVYNCSIGKDRTGIVSYLFLTALGVSEEVALADYLLTNTYNVAAKYAIYTDQFPALIPLFEAKEQYIGAAVDQIKADHGSTLNFLTGKLKVDIDKMRSIYLY